MKEQLSKLLKRLANWRNWAYGLFWSWNLIFLAFMFLGFAPQILPEMLTAIRTDTIPASFLVYAILLTLIPAVAILLGLTLLRRSPGRLFVLGYGVEGPLMLLLALRFFAVRELTAAVTLLLVSAGLGLITLLWLILDRQIDRRGRFLAYLRLFGLTLLLVIGLYASLWLAFYALPLAVAALTGLVEILADLPRFFRDLGRSLEDLFTDQGRWIPFFLLGFILLFYSGTLLVLMPIAVPLIYFRAWWQGLRTLSARAGLVRALALVAVLLVLWLGLLAWTNRQPQHHAFALLETPPASLAEARALLADEEAIRTGLLNAYLAPQRYFSASGEVYHIQQIYRDVLDLSPQQAWQVQHWYEQVTSPLLYHPVHPPQPEAGANLPWTNRTLQEEPLIAAELYQQFFDRPILDGEREVIVRAVRSTWSLDQARAAWQAVDDREIHLERQELTVTEQGDWAEVELYEVYRNQTGQRQEVVYYFNLPESAVITGVWLGNSPERADRFAYRIAPRGAAQTVYRQQVRRNIDPALVEQIGPRQYRLRIFPVEPMQRQWERDSARSTLEAAPPLYMWLTWRVMARDNGWPMPHLAEKRNVYWDESSVRLVNGQPIEGDDQRVVYNEETWLPEVVPATAPISQQAHRVDFPGGETILARPAGAADLPQPDRPLHLALVLDRSRSMAAQAGAVEVALAQLKTLAETGSTIDVYLTASAYRGEEPGRVDLAELDPEAVLYYGGQEPAELLLQFDKLYRDETYDAILVLTDGAGYELSEGELKVPLPPAPLWLVHLGDDFPLGYDDATLTAIQASGGGLAGSVGEALSRLRLTLTQDQASDPTLTDLIDGYLWTSLPTETAEKLSPTATVHSLDDGFAALAARRLILNEMVRRRAVIDQVELLDHLHNLAREQSIVTPYSSMIVLVTDLQERTLDQLETQADRFLREYETVGETNPVDLTGVPEPEEWLLIGLAVLGLGGYLFFKRRRRQHT